VVGPVGEYRCDYIWDEALLILEAKGYAAHGSPDAANADLVRELAIIEASGHQIISVGWNQVSRRPAALARQIRRIYLARLELIEGRTLTNG
jgi:very-short-patch-repair endonuclease